MDPRGSVVNWDVARLKHVAKLESGHTPSRSVPEHWLPTNDIPWVSLNDTQWLSTHDYISDTAFNINALGLENSSACLPPARAIVFTRDASIGKAAITTRPMAVSQHVIAWLCGQQIREEYLLYAIYAMEPALERLTFGATIKTIGMDDVRELMTPVPPLEEQDRIVDHIRQKTNRIDGVTLRLTTSITKLREYRQALITAAVAGQLDLLPPRPPHPPPPRSKSSPPSDPCASPSPHRCWNGPAPTSAASTTTQTASRSSPPGSPAPRSRLSSSSKTSPTSPTPPSGTSSCRSPQSSACPSLIFGPSPAR